MKAWILVHSRTNALPQDIFELHQVAAPLRKRGWAVAQEGGALPCQHCGQSVIALRCRPNGHSSLLAIRRRAIEGGELLEWRE